MQLESVSLIITLVAMIVTPIVLYFILNQKLSPFERIAEITTAVFDDFDGEDKEAVSDIIGNISHLSSAAANINGIFSDEEAFDSFMMILANKIRKSFIAGLLGEASGDSKRMVKADKVINKAMITGLTNMNPMLGAAAEAMGLNELIEEDPKMFDAIIAAIFNKGGLIEMFKSQNPNFVAGLGDTTSMATPKRDGPEMDF